MREAVTRAAIGAARLRRLGLGAEMVAKILNTRPELSVGGPPLTPEQQALQQRMQAASGFYTPTGYPVLGDQ